MKRTTIVATALLIAVNVFGQSAAAPAPAATKNGIDSHETRVELQTLLRSFPPQVGAVLKLDPTLLGNESYMVTYPALAAFLAQHPDVAHNPAFFLENVPGGTGADGISYMRDIMSDLGGFFAFLVVTSVFIWVIKVLVEHRRWNRAMHLQTEVHGKLLDRLTSNEELLAYIQTPAGRRVLEAAPLPLEGAARPISAPIGRMFWSLQLGLVAIGVGIGFDLVSMRAQSDAAAALYGIGVISLLVGIAFVISAVVFFLLSRRFGLLEPSAAAAARDSA